MTTALTLLTVMANFFQRSWAGRRSRRHLRGRPQYCSVKPAKETLIKSILSFPRRREPSQINKLDPRLRGDDDLISTSLNKNPFGLSLSKPGFIVPTLRQAQGERGLSEQYCDPTVTPTKLLNPLSAKANAELSAAFAGMTVLSCIFSNSF